MADHFLEFIYKRNVIIDFGNGETYEIPFKMIPNPNPACETKVPEFDMNKVHKIRLDDEDADLPEKEAGMSDRHFEELSDDAWKAAKEARDKNKRIRKRVEAYVKSGTIEVVKDPFAHKKATKADPAKPAVTPTPAKPKGDGETK